MSKRRCSLDEVRAVKVRARALFEAMAPVVGIGVTRVGGGYGLKVNLHTAPPAGTPLPNEVDGVPVRVTVIGLPAKQ